MKDQKRKASVWLIAELLTWAVLIAGIWIPNNVAFPIDIQEDLVLSGIVYPQSIAIADLNNDTLNDIAVGHSHVTRPEAMVYYQNPNGTFDSLPTVGLMAGGAPSVAAGDLNNDDLIDLAAASWIDNTVVVFYQKPNNTLQPMPDITLSVAMRPSHLAISDMNDDCLSDIAVTNTQSGSITIFYQKDNNTLGPEADRVLESFGGPRYVLAEDLNNDGLVDIASANGDADTVTIYYQKANNTLPTIPDSTLMVTSETTPIPTPFSLASGDLNGDGLADLAVGNLNAENNAVIIFYQLQNFTIPDTPNATISHDRGSPSVAIGDLNSDGLDDLVTLNTFRDNATIYYQGCDHTLSATPDLTILTRPRPRWIAIGLVNSDTLHDIVVSNTYSNNVTVYYQEVSDYIPDLTLDSADVALEPSDQVLNGTEVMITGTIRNIGNHMACNVNVEIYDGNPLSGGQLIGSDSVGSVPIAEERTAQAFWTATPVGSHDIYIAIDPMNTVVESNETNNMAYRVLDVLSPVVPYPPSNLTARLTGEGLSNVTLEWDLSSSDGEPGNVTRYEILRNESSYRRDGEGYTLVGSVPNGSWRFVDEGVGEGNPFSYFYRVCAIGNFTVSSCADEQVAKYSQPLSQGPNLLSIPLIQSNESIETVLQTVKYDKAWYYDSSFQEWKWFTTYKEYRRGLWMMNHTMGIWVNVTRDSNLTVAGVVPAHTTIHLYHGWNLVSFPSLKTTYTVAELKIETGATRVEGCNPLTPYHLRVLGDAEVLLAGLGYWVKVEADTVWTVEVS